MAVIKPATNGKINNYEDGNENFIQEKSGLGKMARISDYFFLDPKQRK